MFAWYSSEAAYNFGYWLYKTKEGELVKATSITLIPEQNSGWEAAVMVLETNGFPKCSQRYYHVGGYCDCTWWEKLMFRLIKWMRS